MLSNLTDIQNAVLDSIGQYGLSLDSSDTDAIKQVVNHALDEYSAYLPYVKEETIYIQAGGQDLDPAPDYVLSCEMVLYMGRIPDPLAFTFRRFQGKDIGIPSKLWKYHKPTIYVPASADYEIREAFKYYLDSDGNVQPAPIPYMLFIDLVTARLLMALGRRRRMVRFGDVSVELDGDQLVGEGQNLLESTLQRLYDSSSIHQTL